MVVLYTGCHTRYTFIIYKHPFCSIYSYDNTLQSVIIILILQMVVHKVLYTGCQTRYTIQTSFLQYSYDNTLQVSVSIEVTPSSTLLFGSDITVSCIVNITIEVTVAQVVWTNKQYYLLNAWSRNCFQHKNITSIYFNRALKFPNN